MNAQDSIEQGHNYKGWWQASDNNWYPPEQHPAHSPDQPWNPPEQHPENPLDQHWYTQEFNPLAQFQNTQAPKNGWWLASDNNWYPPEQYPAQSSDQPWNPPAWNPPEQHPANLSAQHLYPLEQHPAHSPGQQWNPPSWDPPALTRKRPYAAIGEKISHSLVPEQGEQVNSASTNNLSPQLWSFAPIESTDGEHDLASFENESDEPSVDYSGLTYLITGMALCIIYIPILIEVLAQHAVLGFTLLSPILPLILTARLWIIRNKIVPSNYIDRRSKVLFTVALLLRILCIFLSIVILFSSS